MSSVPTWTCRWGTRTPRTGSGSARSRERQHRRPRRAESPEQRSASGRTLTAECGPDCATDQWPVRLFGARRLQPGDYSGCAAGCDRDTPGRRRPVLRPFEQRPFEQRPQVGRHRDRGPGAAHALRYTDFARWCCPAWAQSGATPEFSGYCRSRVVRPRRGGRGVRCSIPTGDGPRSGGRGFGASHSRGLRRPTASDLFPAAGETREKEENKMDVLGGVVGDGRHATGRLLASARVSTTGQRSGETGQACRPAARRVR